MATLGNKKNIIVGAARIYVGPSLDPVGAAATVTGLKATGTTAQADHMEATGQVNAGWRNVGFTQDGLEFATDPSFGEVEVDQLLDAARIFKDGMSVTLSTTFAEATLDNLLIAWGQSDDTLASSGGAREIDVTSGELGEAPLERGLVAVGNGPEGANGQYTERTYFAYRVLSVEASTHSLARAEATTIPVSFRALPADNGRYGSIRDRVVG